MAFPADIQVWTKESVADGSPNEVATLRAQVNALTDTVRLLTAKLDVDAGVTDTNYTALLVNNGVGTAPARIIA